MSRMTSSSRLLNSGFNSSPPAGQDITCAPNNTCMPVQLCHAGEKVKTIPHSHEPPSTSHVTHHTRSLVCVWFPFEMQKHRLEAIFSLRPLTHNKHPRHNNCRPVILLARAKQNSQQKKVLVISDHHVCRHHRQL